MRYYIRIGLFLIVANFLLAFVCSGQNAIDDLAKMNKSFMNAKSYATNVKVNFYEKLNNDTIKMSYKGFVKKSKQNYISEINGKTILLNDKCLLIVDDNQKTLYYGDPLKTETVSQNALLIDTALLKGVTFYYVDIDNNHKHVRAKYLNNEYDSIDVVFNAKEYFLEKVIYYYKQNDNILFPKVIITYSDTKIDKTIPESEFSEKEYITYKGNSILGKEERLNFKVIKKT